MTFSTSLFSFENAQLLIEIAFIILFVPVLSAALLWRRLNKRQKLIGSILFLSMSVELLTKYLGMMSINNMAVYHFYMPLQFFLMTQVYKETKVKILSDRTLVISSTLFFLFAIINGIWFQSIFTLNENILALGSFAFAMFSIMYFYRLLQTSSNESFLKDPVLWFSVGNLLYYSSMFIFFVPQVFLEINFEALVGVLTLNAFFYIVFSLFYTGALWIKQ